MKSKKKKRGAPAKRDPKRKRFRSVEIFSFLVLVFALFCALSLITYSAQDPSWASSKAVPGTGVANYGGRVGASLAEGLLQFLGLGAFLVPVLLGYLGIRTLLPRGEERLLWRVASGLWLLLLLCSLFAVVQDGGFAWKGAGFELAGGLPGKLFGVFSTGISTMSARSSCCPPSCSFSSCSRRSSRSAGWSPSSPTS